MRAIMVITGDGKGHVTTYETDKAFISMCKTLEYAGMITKETFTYNGQDEPMFTKRMIPEKRESRDDERD